MGAVGFFGYGFIALSPLVAVSVVVIARKSFLVLLALLSSAWYLLSMLGASPARGSPPWHWNSSIRGAEFVAVATPSHEPAPVLCAQ